MRNVRRLGAAGAAVATVAAIALVAAQVVSAAPAAKVGTSYWAVGAEPITANGLIIKAMYVPPGKYHLSATVIIENGLPNEAPGGYLRKVYCSMFSNGNSFVSLTSVDAGGFATIPIEGVVDASRSTVDVFVDVECRTDDPTASPLPMGEVTLVADVMAGAVRLP